MTEFTITWLNSLICPKIICSCAKLLVPLPTKNRNAEPTINVIAGMRARMALDSY